MTEKEQLVEDLFDQFLYNIGLGNKNAQLDPILQKRLSGEGKDPGCLIISEKYLNDKLEEIATKLPMLVQNPASFACGHAMGYKQALLDIDKRCSNTVKINIAKHEQ